MENGETEEISAHIKNQLESESDNLESRSNFQKFIYDLFEKNGILNDLRAYLRGHIIGVLKNAQTGNIPPVQKHFTERLELTHQALNMLLAEYLLRMEFGYSLSVFVSEIPLANMVFDFAKSLHQSPEMDPASLHFKSNDVWSILNYLGIKCDSEHASNIIEMYNKEKSIPLLLCILRCVSLYRKDFVPFNQDNSSDESTSSLKSSQSDTRHRHKQDRCKHYTVCKNCQSKWMRMGERYKRKKKSLAKAPKEPSENMESLMKNVGGVERVLVDEMFEQLKKVYEDEVAMVKAEEENKMKKSIESHARLLQQRRDEMEESFRLREQELERNVQQKKKFLWGLARALRDQHAQMSRAMVAVKNETDKLTAKEDSLKLQLTEAEKILRKRGEEARMQISNELLVLEGHLASMKKERDNIIRERNELEQLRNTCDNTKTMNLDADDSVEIKCHYDLLKNELSILKKYLEATRLEPKCVIDRGTLTELSDVTSKISVILNNEEASSKDREEPAVKTYLVNDLKKQKNVNFSQANMGEVYRERSCTSVGALSAHSLTRDIECGTDERARQLAEENERLKSFARQQREHIDALASQQARLQAELAAARFRADVARRSAPARAHYHSQPIMNGNTSAGALGWRKGAGEELSFFANAQPRIILPGDPIPFVGVPREHPVDHRRHLLNQWRMLRRRGSPLSGVGKTRSVQREHPPRPSSAGPAVSSSPARPLEAEPPTRQPPQDFTYLMPSTSDRPLPRPRNVLTADSKHRDKSPKKNREKSPKSMLREAKERLRNKENIKEDQSKTNREKSPCSVLKEAKLRLRKLEIEAEAVEKSYLDFRKKQDRERSSGSREGEVTREGSPIIRCRSLERLKVRIISPRTSKDREPSLSKEFDKYLRAYQNNVNIGETHFKNKNSALEKIKPIPEAYSRADDEDKCCCDYLETPLQEFRKLYRVKPRSRTVDNSPEGRFPVTKDSEHINVTKSEHDPVTEAEKDALIMETNDKKVEYEILKKNITKLYNLDETPTSDTPRKMSPQVNLVESDDRTIQVDEANKSVGSEVRSVTDNGMKKNKETSPKDLFLVVQSSVETQQVVLSEAEGDREISANMTILISPKFSSGVSSKATTDDKRSDRPRRSVSPEQAAMLTKNDVLDAIFHKDGVKDVSSIEMQLDTSKENISKEILDDSISEVDKENQDDYPDDFSADVDNYTRSEYNHSPISLPKTSDDETFWNA